MWFLLFLFISANAERFFCAHLDRMSDHLKNTVISNIPSANTTGCYSNTTEYTTLIMQADGVAQLLELENTVTQQIVPQMTTFIHRAETAQARIANVLQMWTEQRRPHVTLFLQPERLGFDLDEALCTYPRRPLLCDAPQTVNAVMTQSTPVWKGCACQDGNPGWTWFHGELSCSSAARWYCFQY